LTIVVLLVLAAIWGAVIIQQVRSRVDVRPVDSIVDFRRQLSVLRRTSPMGPSQAAPAALADMYHRSTPQYAAPVTVAPATARRLRTQRRRREVFYSLAGGSVATLLLGLVPGLHPVLMVHLLVDIAFVGYLAALVRFRNIAAERDMKLRFLPAARPAEPALLLRRSAVN
jgi:hypothetical protein